MDTTGSRRFVFIVAALCVLVIAASCGHKRLATLSQAPIASPASQETGGGWLMADASISTGGFSLIPGRMPEDSQPRLSLSVARDGDAVVVSVTSEEDVLPGALGRISADDPFYLPTRVDFSPELEGGDILKLSGIAGNAVDFAVERPHLESISEVKQGGAILTARFAYDPSASDTRRTLRVPRGDVNRVKAVDIFVDVDGVAHVTWEESNLGDYDNDGEVAVADLTPIAIHFLSNDADVLLRVDGNGDGEVGVADITPIAQNYGSRVAGYNVYRVEENGGVFRVAARLLNSINAISLVSVDRPSPPYAGVFAQYQYADEFPPSDRRFLYSVKPFDGMFEEGEGSFPLSDYTFRIEAARDWSQDQTIAGPFGHGATIPAGTLPAGSRLDIREVAESEVPILPEPGVSFVTGVDVKLFNQNNNPIPLPAAISINIPIPLGISSIGPATLSASGLRRASVDAPATLPLYRYDPAGAGTLLDTGPATLNAETTAYSGTITDTGVYCLFGGVVMDFDPPVWSGQAGAQTATVAGDNLVDVGFGTANDPNGPVIYNVYFSTATPVDFSAAEVATGFAGSPAQISAVRGAADYYFVVRAQDKFGNEDTNTKEAHVFVPRPNDSVFLTTDKDIYEVGETIHLTANVKKTQKKLFQLNVVRVTYTPLVSPMSTSYILGSFFDYHDGLFFPAPIIPIAGNPSFIEFNASFAQASKEAPSGSSGDLFSFSFNAEKVGFMTFDIPEDKAGLNPYAYYTSLGNSTPVPFTWHQGYTVKIVQVGQAPQPTV